MTRLAVFVATVAYCGYFPFAPGTVGSAAGLVVYLLVWWSQSPFVEVGLIVASVGAKLSVVSPTVFSVVVMMSVVTTLVVPPLLSALYRGRAPGALDEDLEWDRQDSVLPDM